MAKKTFGMSGKVGARFTGGAAGATQGNIPFPSDPDAALREAVSLSRSGKLADAEMRCRYVLDKRPDDANALHLLGVIALNKGRAADAIPLFEQAIQLKARIPDFQTNLGVAYMMVGREADGVARFRNAIDIHSGHGDGHFNLGLALLKSEGPAAALEHLQVAARLLPKHPGAQMHLGLALAATEGPKAGLRFFEKAVELNPRDPQIRANLGTTYLALGRPEDALEQLDAALAVAPKVADLHFGRAKILARLGRIRQAGQSYLNAIKLNDKFAAAHSNLAQLMVGRDQLDEAEAHIRKAIAIKPDDIELHMNLATVLATNDKTRAAVTVCQGVEQRNPEFIDAYLKHASILQEAGDYEGAREVIDILRHIEPDPAHVLPLLVTDPNAEIDDEALQQAVVSVDAGKVRADRAAPVCFALGKVFERRQRYDDAFSYYLRGNQTQAEGRKFDAAAHRENIDRLIEVFDSGIFEAHPAGGAVDDRPVFIVGMPRSGTALVEQIIASHRGAGAAGELAAFGILSEELPEMLRCDEDYPECARLLDAPRLHTLGKSYLALQEKRFPDARKFTDKMPENFLHLGLIALTLPNAKIVHCRRNPMDTCWSIFAEGFRGRRAYSQDLAGIGHYFSDYARLMEHWTRALPLPILDVDYEALVADTEGGTREILDFCGLNWDDDCLRFFENRRTVRTASHWQVRQPIYSSSVGRWRHFEKHLGPLTDALQSHGIDPAAWKNRQ